VQDGNLAWIGARNKFEARNSLELPLIYQFEDLTVEASCLNSSKAGTARSTGPPDRSRQMFDLYALRQMPVAEVARFVGTTVIRVYMTKFRITKLLKREIRAIEAEGWCWRFVIGG